MASLDDDGGTANLTHSNHSAEARPEGIRQGQTGHTGGWAAGDSRRVFGGGRNSQWSTTPRLPCWRDGGMEGWRIGWAWPRMAAFNLPAGPRRPVAIRPPVNRATKHVPVLVDGGSRVSEALAVVGGRWYVISGTPPRGSWTRTPRSVWPCLRCLDRKGPQK